MARNEEIAIDKNSHPNTNNIELWKKDDITRIINMIPTINIPLAAKYLEGIHGNKTGVMTAPEI